MMDSGSEEDDIYPEHETGDRDEHEVKMEDVEDGEEEGEEVEDDDSDDEVNFITDAKETPKVEPGSQPKRPATLTQAPPEPRKVSATPTPAIKAESIPSVKADSQPPNDRPGTDYPARHTSKLDPNGNPLHPKTGKPILSTDIDSDFPSDSDKPWRKPGADVTDYFNYGFDEFTWASYCLKQQSMPKEIKEINSQAEQMKAFVEGIPGSGMPGMPGMGGMPGAGGAAGGMPQMPGMPGEADMQQMFQAMMSQGMDPSSMDSNQFMQMMMGGGGAGQFAGQQQPPTQPMGNFAGGGGGFDQQAGGGGGGGGGNFAGRGRGRRGGRNW